MDWVGQGWKTDATAASQEVRFRSEVLPVQGAAAPTGTWKLKASIASGAYADALTVTSAGAVTALSSVTAADATGFRVTSEDSGWFLGSAAQINLKIAGSNVGFLTATGLTTPASIFVGTGQDVQLSRPTANVLALASGDSFSFGGNPAAATTAHRLIKKVTAMGDGAAVDVFTVTVPNAGQSAGVKVTLVSANGSTDAFESTRVAEGFVAIARTSGVATVPTVATLDLAQIATVAAGATHTLAYGVSAVSGLASATQTFTITVTVNDSGNVGGNQVVAIAELVNSETTGVTIA